MALWTDTIVALATAPGVSALGVVRLSGSKAIEIVDAIFPSKKLSEQAGHTLHVGFLEKEGEKLDEVVVSLYRGPRSYTGEDVVEISAHGSPFVLERIIDTCIAGGARLAQPGEYTQRAFLNGRMDLAQAEAVADLIASNTEASRRTAIQNMRGGISAKLKQLRERLVEFAALIELELDFSQEDVEFADRGKFFELIDELEEATAALMDTFRLGNVIRNGVSVAIVGRPNAGKSTLLNALLEDDRAIVSEIAGTTRDTIEELLNINGIIFRLIDTAGIREHAENVIEHAGIIRSREKMRSADLVLFVFDARTALPEEPASIAEEFEKLGAKYLLVMNKADAAVEQTIRERFTEQANLVFISAHESRGLAALKNRMTDTVISGTIQAGDTVVTNLRHFQALQQLYTALTDIRSGLQSSVPVDLLTPDIRRALQYLGEITGEVTNDEMLGWIFGRFCIGK